MGASESPPARPAHSDPLRASAHSLSASRRLSRGARDPPRLGSAHSGRSGPQRTGPCAVAGFDSEEVSSHAMARACSQSSACVNPAPACSRKPAAQAARAEETARKPGARSDGPAGRRGENGQRSRRPSRPRMQHRLHLSLLPASSASPLRASLRLVPRSLQASSSMSALRSTQHTTPVPTPLATTESPSVAGSNPPSQRAAAPVVPLTATRPVPISSQAVARACPGARKSAHKISRPQRLEHDSDMHPTRLERDRDTAVTRP